MARRRETVVPSRPPFAAVLLALPLAAFTAVYLLGVPGAGSVPLVHTAVHGSDREAARFARCAGPVRVTCVVDGDTLWYRGAKIRLADINAPEVSDPACAHEAALGAAATERLLMLLNQGAFTLAPNADGSGRASDRYGRALRVVTRDGASLGEQLVAEGLAEEWKGYRGSWC